MTNLVKREIIMGEYGMKDKNREKNNSEYLEKIQKFIVSLLNFEQISEERLNFLWNELLTYENEADEEGIFIAFSYLKKVFFLNDFERLMVYFALCYDLQENSSILTSFDTDRNYNIRPTIGLVFQYMQIMKPTPKSEVIRFFEGDYPFSRLLFEDTFMVSNEPLLSAPLVLKQRIVSFICNDDFSLPESIQSFCSLFVPTMELERIIIDKEKYNEAFKLLEAIEEGSLKSLCLYGPKTSGKKFLLKHILKEKGRSVIFVDGQILTEKQDAVVDIVREHILTGAFICIHHLTSETALCDKVNRVLKLFERYNVNSFIFVCDDINAPNLSQAFAMLNLDLPNTETSLEMWKYFSKKYQINADFSYPAANVLLTAPKIDAALAEMKACKILPTPQNIMKYAVNQLKSDLGQKAVKVKLNFNWDDLMIEKSVEEKLKDACKHIKFKHKVYDTWGFRDKMAYGQGLCMLFYGPSGTGKTMAAQVIAKELGLSLYRIDLSRIISKYIGETEQNLSMVFNEAAKTNAILFFDEADALFAKRTDIKDSTDKYANAETAFLLQKTEEYSGVSILASNLMYNLDDAFRRRIHYTVYFSLPDAGLRLKIWKSLLNDSMPVEKKVDFDFLADKFEISPAQIKQVVLNAAFLSAAQGEEVTMLNILKALKNEYEKNGKILLKEELENYREIW